MPPAELSSSAAAAAGASGAEGKPTAPAAHLPARLPGRGAGRSGGFSAEGAARRGPSKDHWIARTPNLRLDPHALGEKKGVSSLGPARARDVPGPRAEGGNNYTAAMASQYRAVIVRARQ